MGGTVVSTAGAIAWCAAARASARGSAGFATVVCIAP